MCLLYTADYTLAVSKYSGNKNVKSFSTATPVQLEFSDNSNKPTILDLMLTEIDFSSHRKAPKRVESSRGRAPGRGWEPT